MNSPPLRMRRYPAGFACGIAKCLDVRVDPYLDVPRHGQIGLLGNTPRRPLHKREHRAVAIRPRGQQDHPLAAEALPRDAASRPACLRAGIVERQDLTISPPLQPHLLRTPLAQSYAVSRPRPFED